jgi:hypothetical protein
MFEFDAVRIVCMPTDGKVNWRGSAELSAIQWATWPKDPKMVIDE